MTMSLAEPVQVSGRSVAGVSGGICRWIANFAVACLAALLMLAAPARSGWLDDALSGLGNRLAGKPALARNALDAIVAHLRTLPPDPGIGRLAAAGSSEGHWRFVNARGEAMIAGSPDELANALNILSPEAAATGRLAIYLTEATAFDFSGMLKDLPRQAELFLWLSESAYPLHRLGAGDAPRLVARLGGRLFADLRDRVAASTAIDRLGHRFDRESLRVLSLTSDTPPASSTARAEPRPNAVPVIWTSAERLRQTFASLRGATVICMGLVERGVLFGKGDGDRTVSLPIADLLSAAAVADIDVLILHTSTSAQPGSRNLFLQNIEVANLDTALARAKLSDVLSALAGETPMLVTARLADTAGRILLDVSSAVGLPGAGQTERITATWKEFAQRFTGTVLPRGLTVSLGGAGRASDAGSVLTRWLPVDGATLYLAGLIAGVLGWQRLRRWWTRLWPPEDRREYGSATGYWTAGLVREAIFAAVFVPAAGVPALAVTLANAVRSGWQAFRGARPLSD